MPIDEREFRHALGQFATGVTVVTTRDSEGRPMGLTVNSFASVSLEPPLVSVLAESQEHYSRRFATPGREKFGADDLLLGETGVALVPAALAHIECRVAARLPG